MVLSGETTWTDAKYETEGVSAYTFSKCPIVRSPVGSSKQHGRARDVTAMTLSLRKSQPSHGTVRFLGLFLADPLDVPEEVISYVADQLKIDELSNINAYGEREKTAYEHAWEIRRAYGYREFVEAEADLRGFLVARAWTTSDGPQALFDRATSWLIEHKVLLPGATVLARMVTAVRAEAAERLWQQLTDQIDPELRCRLDSLLNVEDGSRFSTLERLRTSPSRLSGPEMVKALERVAEVRKLGTGGLDVSGVPPNRLLVLARHGMAAKAPHLRQLTEPRRTATLAAAVRQLEQVAIDDALDLLDLLMATKLLARAERESIKDTLRRLPRFTAASAKLAAAIQILFEATETGNAVSIEDVWAEIERVVPRSEIAAALAAVMELAPPTDEHADEVWRVELVKRYATVRPFLPMLTEVIRFGAVEGGQTGLKAVRGLGELLGRKKVKANEVVTSLVTGTWKRLVFGNPELGRGLVDHRAYAFCVLEHLHRALRLRDVYAEGSDRWSDPRARLLDGEAWQRAKPDVITALSLSETPDPHLTELAARLDAAYRDVATRLPANAALEQTNEGARISLDRLEAVPEPASLVALRATVARMLPKVDLPDLLLDVHGSTGCFEEFTHVSEASARMDDLPISIAAVLVAEACNVGLRPVVKPSVAALTRDRLSHVDQNYVRAETIVPANGRLIPAQARIDVASAWGGGLVASADGLRFVVAVATINAAHNPHYFGLRRGATWLNAVNDQYSGLGAIVIPGTLRDSMYILDLLLNLDGGQRPEMVVTDNASYTVTWTHASRRPTSGGHQARLSWRPERCRCGSTASTRTMVRSSSH